MDLRAIDKNERNALSDTQVKQILGRDQRIIIYSNLARFNTITEAMGAGKSFVLFFEEDSMGESIMGHWECVWMSPRSPNTIIFFDSYGLKPDECKKFLSDNKLVQLKEHDNILSQLLAKAQQEGMTVMYNPFKYQSMKPDVSTCGFYVTQRLLHKNLNGAQFKEMLEGVQKRYKLKTYDEAVSYMLIEDYGI